MATVKVTIRLPERQLEAIRADVARGEATSVSGYVEHLIAQSLDGDLAWKAHLDAILAASGGPATPDEKRWAREMLTPTARLSR